MKDGYRHEYKYLISRSGAQLLKLRLPHLMQLDPHAGPSGQYTIRSIYFDDPYHAAFFEKQSGQRDRVKYRIRLYNYDERILKLEKKEKHGSLTRKTAQRITREDALALERAEPAGCPDTKGGLAEELRLACLGRGFRPQVLVDYERTPFVCANGNTRITIDENLRTRRLGARLFDSHQAMIPVLEKDQVILEIKFDDFLPRHFSTALADIPREAIAISKFALCMNRVL